MYHYLVLLAATFLLVGRVFGARCAALVLLFFTLTPVNNERLVGGFLQYDWFCAVAAGLACLRRGRPWSAGALVAFAVATRVFPAVLVASAAIPPALRWVRTGGLRRAQLSFFLALGLTCGLGLVAGSLTGRGPGAWLEFLGNLGFHSSEHVFGERRVGLKHFFTHDLRSLELEESRRERREHFERQEGLYRAAAVLCLLLFVLAARRRSLPDGLLFGLIPLFVLAVSSRYYWALLALLPLLARPGPRGRRRVRILDGAQAAVYLLYYLYAMVRPEAYATYSIFNLALVSLLVVWLTAYLAGDLRALRRRSIAAPPSPG